MNLERIVTEENAKEESEQNEEAEMDSNEEETPSKESLSDLPECAEIQQSGEYACESELPEVPDDDEAIPPVAQIKNLLTEFEMKVPVWGLTVFTIDGYILAYRLFYNEMPENIEMAASSMSAGLITISEDFIRLVNASSQFKQVLIDADDENGLVHFSILLKHVADNVMLTVIFPSSVQLGLVAFEVENLAREIREIVGLWDVKLHDDTVT